MKETLRSGKWMEFVLGVVSFVSFAFLGWSTYLMSTQPYEGFDWTFLTGEVYTVAPDSPAEGMLLPGDIILTWDGVPIKEAGPYYYGKLPGDSLDLYVRRGGGEFHVPLTLSTVPTSHLVRRMIPLVVAMAFWAVCVVTLAYGQERKHARGLCLWCMSICGILASGANSSIGPLWVSGIFNILVWFIGAISIHLYTLLLRLRQLTRTRVLIYTAYGISFAGSLPILLIGVSNLRASVWMGPYYLIQRLYLALCLLVAIALLVQAVRQASSRYNRLRIHTIAMSNGLALLPIIALSILPDCLFHRSLIPWEFSFLFLLIIPVGYAYAIIRHRIVAFDHHIHRGAMYSIVFCAFVCVYMGLSAAINALCTSRIRDSLWIETLILLGLSTLFVIARDRVRRLSDRIFFGGYYDYRLAVEKISEGLKTIDDISALLQTIARRILETVHLEHVCILTSQPDELYCAFRKDTCVTEQILRQGMADLPSVLPEPGALSRILKETKQPLEIKSLRETLSDIPLTDGERAVLSIPDNNVIVSIPGRNCLLGAIFIGMRLLDDTLSEEDVDIFRAVARQFSVKLQSIRLLGELEGRAAEAERLHNELVRAREEERMQLARELHDGVIQDLVSLNYQFAQLEGVEVDWIGVEIRKIILSIRRVCRRLRPPTLEHLGLVAAIRSLLREFREECGESMEVIFRAEEGDFESLSEDIGICVYRVLCEALANVRKHSHADRVHIALGIGNGEVNLVVKDNGEGFTVPHHLGQFIMEGHYGLAGVRERVEQVHGSFEIGSNQDGGTRIACRIPIEDTNVGSETQLRT